MTSSHWISLIRYVEVILDIPLLIFYIEVITKLIHSTIWMKFENVRLSERNRTHVAWFHLHEVSRLGKSIVIANLWFPWVRREFEWGKERDVNLLGLPKRSSADKVARVTSIWFLMVLESWSPRSKCYQC